MRSVVRFYSGPPFKSGGTRSGHPGDVAQLGERGLCKPEVDGSNPFISTIKFGVEAVVLASLNANKFWLTFDNV